MAVNPDPDDTRRLLNRAPPERAVDRGHLWAGGLSTAMVAQLLAATGMLLSYGLLDLPVVTADRSGGNRLATGLLMGAAILAALAATLLLDLLLLVAPEPMLFFSWICLLATVLAAGCGFLAEAPLPARISSALLPLAIGVTVTVLLTRVAHGAVRSQVALIWQHPEKWSS